jgi:hypothetical protein
VGAMISDFFCPTIVLPAGTKAAESFRWIPRDV